MKGLPNTILLSLEALFLRFSIRRLLSWLFIIVAAGALLIVGEELTGFIFFMNMGKKVSLLKDLNDLAQAGITNNSELSTIYREMVSELASYHVEPSLTSQIKSASSSLNLRIPEEVGKFVSGGLLGFLIALSGFAERKKRSPGWSSIALIGLAFGVLAGLLGILIPTFHRPWVNYLGYPGIQVIAIFLIYRAYKTNAR